MTNTKEESARVAFYFRVDFMKNEKPLFQASFRDVSGLSASKEYEKKDRRGDERFAIKLPGSFKHEVIKLKYSLDPMPTELMAWIRMNDERNEPYDMIICLPGQDGDTPLATWFCSRSYPVKWSLDNLNFTDNRILETLELVCDQIERKS